MHVRLFRADDLVRLICPIRSSRVRAIDRAGAPERDQPLDTVAMNFFMLRARPSLDGNNAAQTDFVAQRRGKLVPEQLDRNRHRRVGAPASRIGEALRCSTKPVLNCRPAFSIEKYQPVQVFKQRPVVFRNCRQSWLLLVDVAQLPVTNGVAYCPSFIFTITSVAPSLLITRVSCPLPRRSRCNHTEPCGNRRTSPSLTSTSISPCNTKM